MAVTPVVIRLRELREARSLTQSDLSRLSGVPQATISRIESGTSAIGLKVLEKLANALEVDAALLVKHERRGK